MHVEWESIFFTIVLRLHVLSLPLTNVVLKLLRLVINSALILRVNLLLPVVLRKDEFLSTFRFKRVTIPIDNKTVGSPVSHPTPSTVGTQGTRTVTFMYAGRPPDLRPTDHTGPCVTLFSIDHPFPPLFGRGKNRLLSGCLALPWRGLSLESTPDQRKKSLHLFTIGFQKPGICATIGFQKPGTCHWIPKTRNLSLVSKNQESALLLDSRNQESAQIPGFWNPMVKRCSGIFSWS